MSSARETILGAIRDALGRGPLDEASRSALDARDSHHTRPAFDDEPVERFIRKFESRAGSVSRVRTLDEVSAAVEAHRAQWQLPRRAAVGAALASLQWPAEWTVHHDAAPIEETLSVSLALAGIAETGSLLFASGPDSPTTHNFVPDDQIAVLHTRHIVKWFEDAWSILRTRPDMPRAVNIVSGPSRTADVEQTVQLGAHGPRRVHVVLVG